MSSSIRMHRKITSVVALTGAMTLAGPIGAAAADPTAQAFALACDNGKTYNVTTGAGKGLFTPAFDTASNQVFVPVEFGTFSGELRDAAGNLLFSFSDPATVTKGAGKNGGATCTYTVTEAFTVTEADAGDPSDPEYLPPGSYVFSGSGIVVIKLPRG